MTDPLLVRIDGPRGGIGRMYHRTDTDRFVPSVTTAISLTPKPYLLNWVVSLAAKWTAENVHRLAPLPFEERAPLIKAETRTLREEGAKRGTAFHNWVEMYEWVGPMAPTTRPQQAYVDIKNLLNPVPLYTEAMVWNGRVGYAGTLDAIWRVGDEVWLIDWKTSKSRSAEWAIQQEAYRRAETIFDAKGVEHPMPPIDRMVIGWLPYDSPWALLEVSAGKPEWEAFKAALTVLHWHKARGVDSVLSTITEAGAKA